MRSFTSRSSSLRSSFPSRYEFVSVNSVFKEGWKETRGWLWLLSRLDPEQNHAISADRNRLWQATKKFLTPGKTPCQHLRWYTPIGLKHKEFQGGGFSSFPTAFAGRVISTGIPQGGAGILAPVCCISWEEGKPGRKSNVRNVVFFCRIWSPGYDLAGSDDPGSRHIEILPFEKQIN